MGDAHAQEVSAARPIGGQDGVRSGASLDGPKSEREQRRGVAAPDVKAKLISELAARGAQREST